jgi:outer membrane protein assembly factor BamB
VVWAKGNIRNAYSSPLIIRVDGLDQLVEVMDSLVFGLNPINGDLQWQEPFKADYGISVATPVWCPGNLLFVSAEYGAGTKMIRLERKGTRIAASEAWSSNRLRLHNGNAMYIDGVLYFTSGGKGSQAILSAVEAASGRILWQERSIQKATFVRAGGKLITLDQDGTLMLANPSPTGFEIVSKSKLLTSLAWTPPVLVGTKLYLRNRKTLMAVELG